MGEKEVVSKEVLPSVHILRNDVFGNYVVQKLMDFGTPAMRVDIQERLQGEMLQLSLQMYGYASLKIMNVCFEKLHLIVFF
jgi:pumilio RNA-binding family